MIAYEDLVSALAAWRTRQGLPVGAADYLGEPPPPEPVSFAAYESRPEHDLNLVSEPLDDDLIVSEELEPDAYEPAPESYRSYGGDELEAGADDVFEDAAPAFAEAAEDLEIDMSDGLADGVPAYGGGDDDVLSADDAVIGYADEGGAPAYGVSAAAYADSAAASYPESGAAASYTDYPPYPPADELYESAEPGDPPSPFTDEAGDLEEPAVETAGEPFDPDRPTDHDEP
jgi:hypothetical protein